MSRAKNGLAQDHGKRQRERLRGRIEENLILLERGKLDPPADGNLALFLLSDGKINHKPKVEPSLSLTMFFRRYRDEFTKGAKEANTHYTEKIHMDHLERVIGPRTGIRSVSMETLQKYVDKRAGETGPKDKPISRVTIQKEVGTFGSIWNKWGLQQALVSGPAPTKGLVYTKSKGKAPFQTWQQIEQRIKRGNLSAAEQEDLWESLFLGLSEIDECLSHVKKTSRFGFVYPAFIDQRTIDAWSGHQTEEMRKRYTHLFPDQQQKAMRLIFGK